MGGWSNDNRDTIEWLGYIKSKGFLEDDVLLSNKYLKLDGTSTTTAIIPFAQGFSASGGSRIVGQNALNFNYDVATDSAGFALAYNAAVPEFVFQSNVGSGVSDGEAIKFGIQNGHYFKIHEVGLTKFEFGADTNDDVRIDFTGTTNSGVLYWMEDEDEFETPDSVNLNDSLKWNATNKTLIQTLSSHSNANVWSITGSSGVTGGQTFFNVSPTMAATGAGGVTSLFSLSLSDSRQVTSGATDTNRIIYGNLTRTSTYDYTNTTGLATMWVVDSSFSEAGVYSNNTSSAMHYGIEGGSSPTFLGSNNKTYNWYGLAIEPANTTYTMGGGSGGTGTRTLNLYWNYYKQSPTYVSTWTNINAVGYLHQLTGITLGATVDVKGFHYNSSPWNAITGTKTERSFICSTAVPASMKADSTPWYWGAGEDCSILYDGTDMQIKPDDVGSGNVKVAGGLYFSASDKGLPHGELWTKDNTNTVTLNNSTWTQITDFANNGQSFDATPDHTNDHITIGKAGKYLVTCSFICLTSSGGANTVELSLFKNNGATELTNIHAHRWLAGANDKGSISMSGIWDAANGDTLELWAKTSIASANIIFEDMNMSIVQIGGT